MSESIELQVNLNTLVQAGWCVEMETGLRGGQIRSWVKLRHFEHAKTHKIRAAPLGLSAAIKVAMADVGLAPFEHSPAPTHETPATPVCGTCKGTGVLKTGTVYGGMAETVACDDCGDSVSEGASR